MEVYGTHIIHGAQSISAPHQTEKYNKSADVETQVNSSVKDELEISNSARETCAASETGQTFGASDIRLDLVNEARAKIASGFYDDPAFLEAALEKLIARNFG